MPKTHEYDVTGTSQFPFDMLRYDSCWPLRQRDVTCMLDRTLPTERTVRILSHSEPTVDRWASFGWKVTR